MNDPLYGISSYEDHCNFCNTNNCFNITFWMFSWFLFTKVRRTLGYQFWFIYDWYVHFRLVGETLLISELFVLSWHYPQWRKLTKVLTGKTCQPIVAVLYNVLVSSEISVPSTMILPFWCSSSLLIHLISVDLPDPDGPQHGQRNCKHQTQMDHNSAGAKAKQTHGPLQGKAYAKVKTRRTTSMQQQMDSDNA